MNLVTINLDDLIENIMDAIVDIKQEPGTLGLEEIERIELSKRLIEFYDSKVSRQEHSQAMRKLIRKAHEAGWRTGQAIMYESHREEIEALKAVQDFRDEKHKAEMLSVAELLSYLVDADDCYFDHHGGCQAHGYLSLEPREVCPQQEAKSKIAEIRARYDGKEI